MSDGPEPLFPLTGSGSGDTRRPEAGRPHPTDPQQSTPLVSRPPSQQPFPTTAGAASYPQIGFTANASSHHNRRPAEPAGSARRPSPRQWALIAAAVLAVVALVLVTITIATRSNEAPTATVTEAAPQSPGTPAAVPACSDPPTVLAESVNDGSGGLTFNTKITTPCADGHALSNDQFRITVADSEGRDVAAGVFDLSASPIALQEVGTSVTFVFPPGTYWRTAGAITGGVRMDSYEDGASSSGGGTGTGTAFTAIGPAAPASGDLDAAAHSALVDIAITDLAYIDANLLNRWQPQLSSKRPGLFADRISWNYPEIVREHLQLRQRFPTARLVWSGDWPVFSEPNWWVTVLGTSFTSGEDALNWCAAERFDRDHCLAKILSHTMGTTGTTLLRP